MEIPGSANFKRSAGSTWALEDESPHLDSTCTEGVKRVTLENYLFMPWGGAQTGHHAKPKPHSNFPFNGIYCING